MNKLYFLIVFLLIVTSANSQHYQSYDFSLAKPEGGVKEYEASESIQLTKDDEKNTSFHYKASEVSNSFLGWINPDILYPPIIGEFGGPTAGDNGLVGTMGGSYTTSPSGALIYEIPIKVPVGINGIQPILSLSYNSQFGNGMLGNGWNLNGISSITRAGSSYFIDEVNKGIEFTSQDHFALDANRLFGITGQYGANLSEYRTEK